MCLGVDRLKPGMKPALNSYLGSVGKPETSPPEAGMDGVLHSYPAAGEHSVQTRHFMYIISKKLLRNRVILP